ncbi:DNA-binding response regulator [Niastella vici]|uniref:DNA-binding response regulator n=1 Tax=Niastella vici TaxID=1703345 RepID=A0A1V9FRR4_9BACT|nr:response regulator transcription factor [Niastella vici]OQP61079.1 DNA-binding response regulator [Niastella vici]
MRMQTINLAIVDHHTLFRKVLKNYLSGQDNIFVTIQVRTMTELLEELKYKPVDILLMDLFMPGLNGLEAAERIRREYPAIKILILSVSMDMDLISDLIDVGIDGFVSKSDEPEELMHAIYDIANNRVCRSRWFTEALYWNKQITIKINMNGGRSILSDREKKILQLLWEEKSNKEVAEELFLGIRTVERIRQEMKEKVGASSTVGLIKFGLEQKIIRTLMNTAERFFIS